MKLGMINNTRQKGNGKFEQVVVSRNGDTKKCAFILIDLLCLDFFEMSHLHRGSPFRSAGRRSSSPPSRSRTCGRRSARSSAARSEPAEAPGQCTGTARASKWSWSASQLWKRHQVQVEQTKPIKRRYSLIKNLPLEIYSFRNFNQEQCYLFS